MTAIGRLVPARALSSGFSQLSDMTVLDALKEFYAAFDLYGGEVSQGCSRLVYSNVQACRYYVLVYLQHNCISIAEYNCVEYSLFI